MSEVFTNAKRDAEDLSKVVNQTSGTVTNRTGTNIRPLPVVIADIEAQGQAAIANTGWFAAAGSFEAGGTITERNQYLQLVTTVGGDVAGGYSWGGSLPKVVPSGSTPETTGGIGPNAWVYRSDTTLRSALADPDSDVPVGGAKAGKIDFTVDKLKDLATVPLIDGRVYRTTSFYDPSVHGGSEFNPPLPGVPRGGSTYVYRSDMPKTLNNGGTILSQESIAAWNGTVADIANLAVPAGSGNGVLVSLDIIKPYIDIFGAVHATDVDNSPVLRNAANAHQSIFVREGTYRFKTKLNDKAYSRLSIIGDTPQGNGVNNIIFYIPNSDFSDGDVWFTPSNLTTQVQSIRINNISFVGDSTTRFNNLSAAVDFGPTALDLSGIKQGCDLSGCAFKRINKAFTSGNFGYIDLVNLSRVTFSECYSPGTLLTVGPVNMDNCMIFDCADWGYFDKLYSKGSWFNNSSYSAEVGRGIKGTRGVFVGGWFEGNNNQIDFKNLYINNAQLAECSPSTIKSRIVVSDNYSVEVVNCHNAVNTRLFYFLGVTDYETISVKLRSITFGGAFERQVSSIYSFINMHPKLKIYADCPDVNWIYDSEKLLTIFGTIATASPPAGDKIVSHIRNARTVIGGSKSFRVLIGDPNNYLSSTQRFHYIRFLLIGSDPLATGNAAFCKEFILMKGSSVTSWAIIDVVASTSWNVSLSSMTATSVDVAITANHAGNTQGDLMFIPDSAEAVSLEFL